MTTASELCWLSVVEAGRLLRAGTVTPLDLARACLARIERLDPGLNAFIAVHAERALEEARAAGAELAAGRDRGPLHGIPIGLKDLVDEAGVPTTAASAAYAHRIPDRDAEVVRRLRAAGAVLIGKLNLHELAYGASSVVGYRGPVRNPWAAGRTAGGSSAGSAVAVAAGLCWGAVGTDTGGSIRQPAAFCGIVGLKPTYGRVSVRGVMPLAPSYDHVGPMARDVTDTALLLQVMAGHDPEDPTSLRLPVPRWADELEGGAPLRVGIARRHFFEGLDPEVAPVIENALEALRALDPRPREIEVPAVTDTTLFRAECWAQHRARAEASPELFQPETLRRLRAGAEVEPEQARRVASELHELRGRAHELFAEVDVIVTPTTAIPPFPVGSPSGSAAGEDPSLREHELVALRNTRPFNALGLPALSVPCGLTRSGLPVGLQIAAAPGAEATALRAGRAFERTGAGIGRRPPVD